MTPRKKIKTKEREVLKSCLDWLTYKKIFHHRNNTGAFTNEAGHFFRFGASGSPDIVCVVNGRYIGIECKGWAENKVRRKFSFKRNWKSRMVSIFWRIQRTTCKNLMK